MRSCQPKNTWYMSGAQFSYKQLVASAFKSLPSRFLWATPNAQEKYLPQVGNENVNKTSIEFLTCTCCWRSTRGNCILGKYTKVFKCLACIIHRHCCAVFVLADTFRLQTKRTRDVVNTSALLLWELFFKYDKQLLSTTYRSGIMQDTGALQWVRYFK